MSNLHDDVVFDHAAAASAVDACWSTRAEVVRAREQLRSDLRVVTEFEGRHASWWRHDTVRRMRALDALAEDLRRLQWQIEAASAAARSEQRRRELARAAAREEGEALALQPARMR